MRIDKSQREGGNSRSQSAYFPYLPASSFAHLDCMADVIFMKRERKGREGVEQFRKSSEEESKQTQQSRQGAEWGSDNARRY